MPNLVLSPVYHINLLIWIKKNLFSTWYNILLTVISILFLYWISSGLIHWSFNQAQWEVVRANLRLFFVGRYPISLLWRAWLSLGIIITLVGFSWGILYCKIKLFNRNTLGLLSFLAVSCSLLAIPVSTQSSLSLLGLLILLIISSWEGQKLGQAFPTLKTWLGLIWLSTFFVVLWVLQGGLFLRTVRLDDLSGLILTLLTSIVSITLSFPFGVLLALGRQSNLLVIRCLSIAYIEIIRGLPLIGILFMVQVMLPLVLPMEVRLDRVIRAIAGLTLFSSAYLAENIRGGLQSVPKGQIEAAKALGFNTIFVSILIVLPQALKAVIPTIVGQFISLFKDTSLLAIVGLVDLLGISQSILANPKFIGRYAEVYLFIAVIYWVFCYLMSLASRQLEQKLSTSKT
ncbi:MAG: amino acid ABC transporter permease [cyanobacterium endosymbiont of Rhopalodia musculus]|uniref:amino acid ABC transporter permease n=1 Tax=cyanobacterium endosymbiont of Epithemia clementina EcSB TaxID=3034674 RepID=UPI00248031A0|nr:amino acid ABC transporter permease [cyanobacterium endosymbiont of Epithemia clementina EcSB]WGT67464.1 amino acid ABC transporter permease [cyanobacterium endosymbiont of Epithemia clementina EcSB]